MKLFKYDEFITESNLDLLLEAKMDFSDEFISVLKNIDLPIAKKLASINSKEVDINQNYIDINKDKSDTIFFKPDDKVGKTAKITTTSGLLDRFLIDLSKIPGSGISDEFAAPSTDALADGDIVQVIKKIPDDEMRSYKDDISKMEEVVLRSGSRYSGQARVDVIDYAISLGGFYLVQWFKNGNKYQSITYKPALDMKPSIIRSSEISVGRFTRAILKKVDFEFKDAEIEEFVYKYKAEIEKIKNVLELRFKVVEGQDIRTYYHRSKYESESGSLGNSCMRYDKCQKYFDIYTKNSQVKLLLFMSEKEEDQICGRAILWEMEPYEVSTKVMDRIYSIRNADEELFKQWAIKNGYWYKEEQSFSEYSNFLFQKEDGTIEKRRREFSVKLDKGGEYSYYPYMDSFKYYEPSTGTLYNSSDFGYSYELTDTDGGNGSCSECGGSGEIECDNCDGEGTRECYNCDGSGTVGCNDCDSDGTIECEECEGEGEVDCSTCDGEDEIECEYCDGSGEIDDDWGLMKKKTTCSECSGGGKQKCPDCESGKEQCSRCDGRGKKDCKNCEASGEIECDDCDGSGERECGECSGSGNVGCPECN